MDKLFFWQGQESDENVHKLIETVNAMELGRIVTRDIGGSDPERMAAPRVLEYVQHAFKGTQSIQIQVVEGQHNFERDYPLFAAVNRAANGIFFVLYFCLHLIFEMKSIFFVLLLI